MSTEKIGIDNLPLAVREHLMRGQHVAAIELLVASCGHTEDSAKQLIEDYRQALRERKVALEIQVMNEEQEKAAKAEQHQWYIWGGRAALALLVLFALYIVL